MTRRILEAVPNFSEGRDRGVIGDIVAALERPGTEVLDWSADPDHNRCVVTVVGEPAAVEQASVDAARVALERIDLRTHEGVHPRIGALDVLPLVPLVGLEMRDAVVSARRVARRIAGEVGVPVFLYGQASEPAGRRLAGLRRGGFEAMLDGWPDGRAPDLLPSQWSHPGAHPSAGASCVGARPVLLAWNVDVEGIDVASARTIAATIRERGGGFRGLRALALELPRQNRLQISMNLEDLAATAPADVFRRIDALARERGGRAVSTEVIGMIPDELPLSAAAAGLGLRDASASRLLSRRIASHLAAAEPDSTEWHPSTS